MESNNETRRDEAKWPVGCRFADEPLRTEKTFGAERRKKIQCIKSTALRAVPSSSCIIVTYEVSISFIANQSKE